MLNNKKVLIFHPTIAPYRLDFFNDLYKNFGAKIYLYYENLKNQKLDYEKIKNQFEFEPIYFRYKIKLGKRSFYFGHIKYIFSQRTKPDIIITGEYNVGTWVAVIISILTDKKIKVVSICDDSLEIAKKCSGIRKISRDVLVKHLSGVILCNEAVDTWYSLNKKVNSYVFPIIHDERKFRQELSNTEVLVKTFINKYGLTGKKVLLFVGRLSKEKNLIYLIDSFYNATIKHNQIVLAIVGDINSDGNEETKSELKNKVERYGINEKVLFLGHLEGKELMAWYNIGQIFVLPSTYEPFGAVVNEALMAGQYVMVSKYAGSACLIDDGNGEIIDVDNEYINFENAISKVSPISRIEHIRDNKMPFSYQEKMDGLVKWLQNL